MGNAAHTFKRGDRVQMPSGDGKNKSYGTVVKAGSSTYLVKWDDAINPYRSSRCTQGWDFIERVPEEPKK